MPLQLDDLAALDSPAPDASGLPLQLPLAAIDEDAGQPRREFDAAALEELADTIRQRGVRQPVSVRPHARQPGRWILNFGARRLRAARLAGLAEIPAFVDSTADSYDQVIENEQREGLKPLELALFVQKRLAQGDHQAEIARRLGKSRQWVTLTTALIEPPDWLLQAYREGRCRGMKELYELRRLHADHPRDVEAWVSDREAISRDAVHALRAELTGRAPASARPGASALPRRVDAAPADIEAMASETPSRPAVAPPKPQPSPHAGSSPRLHVAWDGQGYELVVTDVPAKAGDVYIRPLEGGARRQVPAGAVTLQGFVVR